MRRFITIIVAILYISTSTGATVHLHYCMGKLADWGLGHDKSTTCGKCGMAKSESKKTGCCKDEHKLIKNNADQKIAERSVLLTAIAGIALLPGYTEFTVQHITCAAEEYPISNGPPRSSGIAAYLFNRTLLI